MLLHALALMLTLGSRPAAAAAVATLAELRPGRRFEILENVSIPIPELLRLLGDVPPFQVTEGAVRLAAGEGTQEPVCVVSELALNPDMPNQLSIPKGATVEVTSAQADSRPHPPYAGPSVTFVAREPGTRIKARFSCYAGKGARRAMPIEVFEKLLRRKVRLLSEG
jgi:hypothetical protein